MLPTLLGVALARHTDHEPDVPLTPGLDPGHGLLDDDRSWRFHPEPLRRHKERIRRGLPGRVLRPGGVAALPAR
jgi:hypothetical protein